MKRASFVMTAELLSNLLYLPDGARVTQATHDPSRDIWTFVVTGDLLPVPDVAEGATPIEIDCCHFAEDGVAEGVTWKAVSKRHVKSTCYEDERYCGHCQADTPHICKDSGHERDSSDDYRQCMVCGWYQTGMSNEYSPPCQEQANEST